MVRHLYFSEVGDISEAVYGILHHGQDFVQLWLLQHAFASAISSSTWSSTSSSSLQCLGILPHGQDFVHLQLLQHAFASATSSWLSSSAFLVIIRPVKLSIFLGFFGSFFPSKDQLWHQKLPPLLPPSLPPPPPPIWTVLPTIIITQQSAFFSLWQNHSVLQKSELFNR